MHIAPRAPRPISAGGDIGRLAEYDPRSRTHAVGFASEFIQVFVI